MLTADDAPVPSPRPLTPYSYLHQITPNPLFVGREAELQAIARTFSAGPGTVAVTTGIGGVGKTQLAIEFAQRYGPFFAGGVFWASLAAPSAAGTAVAACGERGLVAWRPDFGQLRPDEQTRLVCQAWQSPLPRLLVFDNCEDETLLQQWRPPTGGCRVLVTSRRAAWSAVSGVAAQPIAVLSRDEARRLILDYRADIDEAGATAIADPLGCLPLALQLAGSFLRRYRSSSTSGYLAQLSGALLDHPSLQGRGAERSPTGHALHVAQTFALSYNQLADSDPVDTTARALLARCAFLAPGEPLPHDFLLSTLELSDGDFDVTLTAQP